MAKKITKPAASAFFNMSASSPPESEAAVHPLTPDKKDTNKPITAISSSASTVPSSNTNIDDGESTFSIIKLPKKSKKTKLTSLKVNEDEYNEFSAIVRELGYNKSTIINQFIHDFVTYSRRLR